MSQNAQHASPRLLSRQLGFFRALLVVESGDQAMIQPGRFEKEFATDDGQLVIVRIYKR